MKTVNPKAMGAALYNAMAQGFWSALMAVLLVLWNVGGWSKEDLETLIDRVMDLSFALKKRDPEVEQLIKDFTEDTGIVLNLDSVNKHGMERRNNGC